MSLDVTSFVDVAQGLGERRKLVLCHVLLCAFEVFLFCSLMILCMYLSLNNNGGIDDDNGEMVRYKLC